MAKILIIEDETDIADLIAFNLQRNDFETIVAHDGLTGEEMAMSQRPDLIVLDLMLPGKDGYSVFKALRRDPRTQNTPVLMLTARAQTEDRIQGLESGADDYLTKPFSPKELVLRVTSVLKRSSKPAATTELAVGPFRCNRDTLHFTIENEITELTSTEFKLIMNLMQNVGKTLDRNDLLRTVWGYSDDVHSRTLDTHMKRLRHKLGDHAELIETIRGVGYRLTTPSDS